MEGGRGEKAGGREPRWALPELPRLPADLGKQAPLKSLGTPEDRWLWGGMVAVAKSSRKMRSPSVAPPENLVLTTVI